MRENLKAVKTVMELNMERRGRPKNKWLNVIECDMRTTSVCINDGGDRVKWRLRTKVTEPQKAGKIRRGRRSRYMYKYSYRNFRLLFYIRN